jgi:hypothetical protein
VIGGVHPNWLKLFALLLAGLPLFAGAHEIRPGLLDIKERDTGWFEVTWKVPVRGERALPVLPIMPDSLELLGTPTVQDILGAQIQRATYKSNGEPLTGKTIVIEGLSALQTDVLLAVEFNDGVRHSAILRPGSPEYTVPLKASKWEVAVSYYAVGFRHQRREDLTLGGGLTFIWEGSLPIEDSGGVSGKYKDVSIIIASVYARWH